MDNFYKGCPAKMEDGRFLTDYRTSTTREQYIKTINGFVRDDEYRMFLQQNGEQILDKEWQHLKEANSCPTTCCVHKYPTRMTHGTSYEELKMYNAVKSGQIKKTDSNYPHCTKMPDYRISHTNKTEY